jgi:hypothetical protein
MPSEKEPHIRIPVAFPESGWGKLSGEKCLNLMPFGRLPVRGFPASFLELSQYLSVFSPEPKKGGFAEIFPASLDKRRPIGAYFRVCPMISTTGFPIQWLVLLLE